MSLVVVLFRWSFVLDRKSGKMDGDRVFVWLGAYLGLVVVVHGRSAADGFSLCLCLSLCSFPRDYCINFYNMSKWRYLIR